MKKKELRVRAWVEVRGKKCFGPGKADLLRLVGETGSISSAAREMGLSYRKAWSMVRDLNKAAITPLVVPQKGGEKGGGATLTPAGKNLLDRYDRLSKKLGRIISDEASLLDLF